MKSKNKVLADLVSGESLLPGSHATIFLLCPHMANRGKRALWGLLYKGTDSPPQKNKGTNPIHMGSIFMTKSLLKVSTYKYHHIGDWLGFSLWIIMEQKHSAYSKDIITSSLLI